MWLFTAKGFYSVVTTDRGGDYMVRGRVKADLDALLPIIEEMRRFGHGWLMEEHAEAHAAEDAVSAAIA